MSVSRRVYQAKDGSRTYAYRYIEMNVPVTARTKERLRERAKREGKTMAQMVRAFVLRGLAEA